MLARFLLAYDGTSEGRAALDDTVALSSRLGATVHLLSVVHLTPAEMVAEGARPGVLLDLAETEARTVLSEGVAELRRAGLIAEGTLSRGLNVADDIVAAARRIDADLIVVGHRDLGALARLWRGSVGRDLIAQAPCSVLVAVAPPTPRAAPAAA